MSKINADRIVSISAIIVSIATLFMILYQTSLTRKHQRASVMPSLEIGYSMNNSDNKLKESIWISNKGLGPAFIENVRIISNEKTIETDPYGILSKTQAKNETTYFDRLYRGRIIPANDGVTTYEKITDSTSQVILKNYFKFPYEIYQITPDNPEKAIIEIIYKSIYGEKWQIRSDQSTPREIE